MANARTKNVILVDTSAAFTDAQNIRTIKYIGASASSVTIKDESSSGVVIWEENASTNVHNPNVDLRCNKGIYVTVSGTAKVYLYLK